MEHASRHYIIVPESGTDITAHHGEQGRIVWNIVERKELSYAEIMTKCMLGKSFLTAQQMLFLQSHNLH